MARCMKRKRRSRCQLVAPMLVTGFTTGFRREQMRGLFTLLFMLVFGAAPVQAQTDVCRGDTPTAGQQIECTEDSTSMATITINVENPEPAPGEERINTEFRIETVGEPNMDAHGIYGLHEGSGVIKIDVLNGDIKTDLSVVGGGLSANGVYGHHKGTGALAISVENTRIEALAGTKGSGVYGQHEGQNDIIDYDIDIAVVGGTITTAGGNSHGVHGHHLGTGKIDVYVENTTITTDVSNANGVYGYHKGTRGDNVVKVVGADITVANQAETEVAKGSTGVIAWSAGNVEGHIDIDVLDSDITTRGPDGKGIYGVHQGEGNIDIDVRGGFIETAREGSYGIYGLHFDGNGDIDIDVRDKFMITTQGLGSHGIYGYQYNSVGHIDINVRDEFMITTQGLGSHGIYGYHTGIGDIVINASNGTIVTERTELSEDTLAHGIYALHGNMSLADNPVEEGGSIDINVQGGSIETKGAYSYGIRGNMEAGNGGGIYITTSGGHTITTMGEGGHGIVAYHYGTAQPTSSITIDAGGSIDTSGAGAQGIRVGALSSGAPDRVAAIGAGGYRQQTVTVNGAVMSAAEGVYLAGGGKVVIGPGGSIASDSGIAILATGVTPVDGGDPLTPKLRVDMNLGGRRVAQAIGDDWIINDGGETTIAVNGTVLHEGATGVITDEVARNGAWNVRMREEGVNVMNYSDSPEDWDETDLDENVATDRDFSAQDFNEASQTIRPPGPGRLPLRPQCPKPSWWMSPCSAMRTT